MSARIKDELDRIIKEIEKIEKTKETWIAQNYGFGVIPEADNVFNPQLDPLKSRKFDLETQYNTAVENERVSRFEKFQRETIITEKPKDMPSGSIFQNVKKNAAPSGSIFQNVKKNAPPSDRIDSFCIQCGAKLKPTAKFCGSCGTSIA